MRYKTDDSLLLMITKHSVIHCYDTFPFLGNFSYSQIPAAFALLCLPASHMIISSRASHALLPEWSPMAGRFQATAQLLLAPLWDHSRPAFPLCCQCVLCLTDNVSLFLPMNSFCKSFCSVLSSFFRPYMNTSSEYNCSFFRFCVNFF